MVGGGWVISGWWLTDFLHPPSSIPPFLLYICPMSKSPQFFPDLNATILCHNDPSNLPSGFAAVMTCFEADENCPFIPGAERRIPLWYAFVTIYSYIYI